MTVYLPQYDTTVPYRYVPFGNSFSSVSTYCQCSSSFTVGITGYGTVSNLNSLTFLAPQKAARSTIDFIFGAKDYRDAFFSSSTYRFNFGFLKAPS